LVETASGQSESRVNRRFTYNNSLWSAMFAFWVIRDAVGPKAANTCPPPTFQLLWQYRARTVQLNGSKCQIDVIVNTAACQNGDDFSENVFAFV